ncbi:hypothetical protein Bbelb_269950 [Branchiostoma belcheri]|nr:hypothetical protein Bbelb_269950 [Branchiostoma belcheri]
MPRTRRECSPSSFEQGRRRRCPPLATLIHATSERAHRLQHLIHGGSERVNTFPYFISATGWPRGSEATAPPDRVAPPGPRHRPRPVCRSPGVSGGLAPGYIGVASPIERLTLTTWTRDLAACRPFNVDTPHTTKDMARPLAGRTVGVRVEAGPLRCARGKEREGGGDTPPPTPGALRGAPVAGDARAVATHWEQSVAVENTARRGRGPGPRLGEPRLGSRRGGRCLSSVRQRAPHARGYNSGDPRAPGTFRGDVAAVEPVAALRPEEVQRVRTPRRRPIVAAGREARLSGRQSDGGDAPGRVGVARRNSPRSARARRRQPEKQSGSDASVSAGGNCENLTFGGRSSNRSHAAARSFDGPPDARRGAHLGEWSNQSRPVASRRRPRAVLTLCPKEALDRGTPARSPTLKDRSLVRKTACIESETATPRRGCRGGAVSPRPRRETKLDPIPRKPTTRDAPPPGYRRPHLRSPAQDFSPGGPDSVLDRATRGRLARRFGVRGRERRAQRCVRPTRRSKGAAGSRRQAGRHGRSWLSACAAACRVGKREGSERDATGTRPAPCHNRVIRDDTDGGSRTPPQAGAVRSPPLDRRGRAVAPPESVAAVRRERAVELAANPREPERRPPGHT